MIIVSEPGLFRLIFRSRKPEAERFKRWLAHEVLPAIRKTGRFEAAPVPDSRPAAPEVFDVREAPVLQKVAFLNMAMRMWGIGRAQGLYRQLGMPALPPPPLTARDEAWQCLRHLLDWPLDVGLAVPQSVRHTVEGALNDDEEARRLLLGIGIRTTSAGDGFVLATRHPGLAPVFDRSEWAGGRHTRVLQRLPDTAAAGATRFDQRTSRGTIIPAHYLDEAETVRPRRPADRDHHATVA